MPRLRFLHTADWHLGASWSRLTGRVADLVAWRFEAVRRAYRHADAEKASFIVVAGDVFDSEQPAEKVAAQAADLLNQAPVPLYIIPAIMILTPRAASGSVKISWSSSTPARSSSV